MAKGPTSRSSSLNGFQKLLVVLLVGVAVSPLLPFPSSPELLSPVDRSFLWGCVAVGVVLSQVALWGSFASGKWKPGYIAFKTMFGLLAVLFGSLFGVLFGLRAGSLYSYYELGHLGHEQRSMLYVVESASTAGRGGPRAYVNPYGFGRRSLPLSRSDYDAFRADRISPTGLVCYRVSELRRGDVIGVVKSLEWHSPSGALVPCQKSDRRLVMNVTNFHFNWK